MIETGVSIAVLLLVVFQAVRSSKEGFFRVGGRMIFTFFALIVALRFWFPTAIWLSSSFGIPDEQLAFVVFWGLFGIAYLPFQVMVRSLNEDFVPSYPAGLEKIGSMLAGGLQCLFLSLAAVMSIIPFAVSALPDFDPSKMLLPLDRLPVAVYHTIESKITGVEPGNRSRTLLPTLFRDKPEDPANLRWQ